MGSKESLEAELKALQDESKAMDEAEGMTPEERELRAKVRSSRLDLTARKLAKKHGKVYPVDMDKDGTLPEEVVFQGQTCRLHSQFIIRGATKKEMDAFTDAIQDIDATDPYRHDKRNRATRALIDGCMLYPTKGTRSDAEHSLDIDASFARFPGLLLTLSDEAAALGGMIAKANRKSVG